MAESSAKVRLTLDGQQAIREADRLKSKMREAATVSGELGKNWQRGGIELAKQLVGVMALVAGLKQAADAAARLRREQGEAAQERVAGSRKLLAAGGRAGLNQQQIRLMEQDIGEGAYTYEDAASMVDRAREARVRDPEEIRRAARLRGTGLFQDDEIIDTKRRRVIRQADVDRRYAMESESLAEERKAERAARAREVNRFSFGERDISRAIDERAKSGGVAAAVSALTPEFLERSEMAARMRAFAVFQNAQSRPIPVDTTAGKPRFNANGEGAP